MPADALPRPWATALFEHRRWRHEWRDPLNRPMSGQVTFTAKTGTRTAGASAPRVPVIVKFTEGVLDVDLLPDVYGFTAELWTVDGTRHIERGEIDLSK